MCEIVTCLGMVSSEHVSPELWLSVRREVVLQSAP